MRRFLTSIAACTALTLPALADDGFPVGSRDDFNAAVRAYLLDNPEVLLEAMQVLDAREAEARAAVDEQLVAVNAQALFEGDDWVGGNPDGDVTLVEFIDYNCGYCKRARPEVNALIDGDSDLRLIRIELPILGAQSELAAQFAIATRSIAGDDAYAEISEALMALRAGAITDDAIRQLSDAYGFDTDAILAEMDSDATRDVIAENRLLAMRLQIQGTPAFVLDDMMLRGYLPLEDMQALVALAREGQ